jgi:hypothetical protein
MSSVMHRSAAQPTNRRSRFGSLRLGMLSILREIDRLDVFRVQFLARRLAIVSDIAEINKVIGGIDPV